MRRHKVYFETTLFSYYLDKERDGHIDTVRMFEAIRNGEFDGYTSQYVVAELQSSPEPKRTAMIQLITRYDIKVLEYDGDAERLAALYIREGIIPARFEFDSIHIASATVNDLDFVLSFNYRHINKQKTKQMTALVNIREGYKPITICTPMEVLDYDE